MKQEFERIAVVGLGYVGLPTAAVLANRGMRVVGIDVDAQAVARINGGEAPIVEPDLDVQVRGAVASGRLRATTEAEPADAFIIAVPTPFADGHKPDLSYLERAAQAIAPVLVPGNLVILESTSPPGTTEKLSEWLAGQRGDLTFPHLNGADADIHLAHSPERVLPGRVLLELVENDRVIGGLTPVCAERAARLYRLFVNGRCFLTDAKTAELVKLAENAFRDTNIAFANELAAVAERLGVDVWEVIELANHHPRVDILRPGPGVGGHCIAIDPWFIVDAAPDDTPLIQAARAVNRARPDHVVGQVLAALETSAQPSVACLGLAYKADIDDLRESPAVIIAGRLADVMDGEVLTVEPNIRTLPDTLSGRSNLRLVDLETALTGAGVVVLLAEHREFVDLDPARLEGKTVIDTRGVWRQPAGRR